jgi:hypothetical protein
MCCDVHGRIAGGVRATRTVGRHRRLFTDGHGRAASAACSGLTCAAESSVYPALSARLFPGAGRREGGALMARAAGRESVTVAGRAERPRVARAFTAGVLGPGRAAWRCHGQRWIAAGTCARARARRQVTARCATPPTWRPSRSAVSGPPSCPSRWRRQLHRLVSGPEYRAWPTRKPSSPWPSFIAIRLPAALPPRPSLASSARGGQPRGRPAESRRSPWRRRWPVSRASRPGFSRPHTAE